MKTFHMRVAGLMLAVPLALGGLALPAFAVESQSPHDQSKERQAARETLQKAQQTFGLMQADPQLRREMQRAQGLLILPHFARAGLGVGGKGGEGVLLVRKGDGEWSDPVFYNVGGVSVGLQAGVAVGRMAFLLMTPRSVDSFRQKNNFSLNANAGLTIVDWSARAQASAGKGDVIAWSDTKGLFGGATIGMSDVNFDEDENASFYRPGEDVSAQAILDGHVGKAPAAAQQMSMAVATATRSGRR